jgi:hypothetical protein
VAINLGARTQKTQKQLSGMKNKFSSAVFLFTFISGTAENVSESAKHEKGPDDLGTVENETCRTQYRRKRIRERKT